MHDCRDFWTAGLSQNWQILCSVRTVSVLQQQCVARGRAFLNSQLLGIAYVAYGHGFYLVNLVWSPNMNSATL